LTGIALAPDCFKGLDGGSQDANYVLHHEIFSLLGALPRTTAVAAIDQTIFVRSRAIAANGLPLPLPGQTPASYPLAGTVASVDHGQVTTEVFFGDVCNLNAYAVPSSRDGRDGRDGA
jgi:hypothetical protein